MWSQQKRPAVDKKWMVLVGFLERASPVPGFVVVMVFYFVVVVFLDVNF